MNADTFTREQAPKWSDEQREEIRLIALNAMRRARDYVGQPSALSDNVMLRFCYELVPEPVEPPSVKLGLAGKIETVSVTCEGGRYIATFSSNGARVFVGYSPLAFVRDSDFLVDESDYSALLALRDGAEPVIGFAVMNVDGSMRDGWFVAHSSLESIKRWADESVAQNGGTVRALYAAPQPATPIVVTDEDHKAACKAFHDAWSQQVNTSEDSVRAALENFVARKTAAQGERIEA